MPYDLAPTFRGQFAKYAYKVTIGAQKFNKNTQLLRLPFKVYSLLGMINKLFFKIKFLSFLSKNRFEIKEIEKYVLKNVTSNNKNKSIKRRSSLFSINDASEEFNINNDSVNPFRIEEKSEHENLEFALQFLEDLTSANSNCQLI